MLSPNSVSQPYYVENINAADNSWTAKFVFVACNAWSSTQGTWLTNALSQSTTYTFVVRHESSSTTDAPGVTPSETIIAKYPCTLRIVGHTHEYYHSASSHEVIVGNGGAPLTGSSTYGYAIVERLASGVIQVTGYDYQSNAMTSQFRINADGSAAP
jgi:hypothetical protein